MLRLRHLAIGLLPLLLVACGASSTPAPAPASAPTPAPTAPAKPKLVAITQLVQHPSLDLVRQGVLDGLKAAGFEDGKNIKVDYQNAQGDMAMTKTVADKFVAETPDIIITLTTPSAQAVAKAVQNTRIPMIFSAVSDPVGAQLLGSVDQASGTNITGVYNFDPTRAQLDLFAQIMPDLKTLGVIYNPGESNSVSTVKRMKDDIAKRSGWKLVEAPANSSAEVQTAAQSLIGRVQAIYMPQDNTVVSAFDALLKVAQTGKTPLFVSDAQSVGRGAIATVGSDEYKGGVQAGAMAARVLKGEDPGKVKPEVTETRHIFINSKAADAFGIKLPDDVKKVGEEQGK